MTRAVRIETLLREHLAALEVDVVDESAQHAGHAGARSGGGHFAVRIISPMFEGKTRLQCHRLVYAALQEMMIAEIHALSIEAFATPSQLRQGTRRAIASPDL